MITYYFRSVKEEQLQSISTHRPGTWVYVEKPTSEEIKGLAVTFNLDEDILKDATDLYEVPRFEHNGDASYFFTRFPNKSEQELGTAIILLIITPTVVLTVSNEHPAMFDSYTSNKIPVITTQRTKLFLLLISAINKYYRANLVSIQREVQRNRVHLSNIHNKDIVLLVGLESTLNEFINALMPSFSAIQTIISGNHIQLYEEDRDIIEDIQLENKQQIETAKINLKSIQNIRSAYTAIVTNNLNSIIKLLTSLTIILTIPTILGSLFGMNVALPFANAPHTFFGIMFFAGCAMALVAYFFTKRDWM
jgi:magnesium transporter